MKAASDAQDNKGSTVIEMCFIMPIILGIVVLIIFTLIKNKDYAKNQCDNYTQLYLYEDSMIYGECQERLRRWQLYGDVLCE